LLIYPHLTTCRRPEVKLYTFTTEPLPGTQTECAQTGEVVCSPPSDASETESQTWRSPFRSSLILKRHVESSPPTHEEQDWNHRSGLTLDQPVVDKTLNKPHHFNRIGAHQGCPQWQESIRYIGRRNAQLIRAKCHSYLLSWWFTPAHRRRHDHRHQRVIAIADNYRR